MGGYGGMDMGMGGMDMMGGQGPTMEQLEQLRMQDPQAFEQLMYMMSQQMQRWDDPINKKRNKVQIDVK